MTQPNLKCYWTYDVLSMEHQDIVFAASRSAAIYASEAYSQEGVDWIDIRAKRKPHFDQYAADGVVPDQDLLNDGWWLECRGWGCDTRLTSDDNPLIDGNRVFCNESCRDRKQGERKAE